MKKVKFFFPDSHDYVDPSFDFLKEQGNEHRIRQRDDVYPHELMADDPYDGMLVSKAIVDGTEKGSSKYSIAQRQRFLRQGARKFLRLPARMGLMGDCGAFSYVSEYEPPYSVEEVAEFYERSGFDYGISVDHIIFQFETENVKAKKVTGDELVECKRRQQLTLDLARDFLEVSQHCGFTPLGVAHCWNPTTMAESVAALQKMGYKRVTLGGMVPLKTEDIFRALEAIDPIRSSSTEMHLLGVSRVANAEKFGDYGVSSFDTTSPLMQAFKDAKNNYHLKDGSAYSAIRVPQVDGNPALKRAIQRGAVDQDKAKKLERESLKVLRAFDRGDETLEATLNVLSEYECLIDPSLKKSYISRYKDILEASPWKTCSCSVCSTVGIEVAIFRGAERNRRRGFHNIYVLHERLKSAFVK